MAKPATAAKPQQRAGSLGLKFAALSLIGAALTALPLCMVALPGMVPTLAAAFVDRRRPRYLTFAVAIMNFAGVAPFLIIVVKNGMTFVAAAQKLADPFTWLIMYGAAAGGWLIFLAMIPLARVCIEVQASQRRRQLEAAAAALREEWGEDVAGTGKT